MFHAMMAVIIVAFIVLWVYSKRDPLYWLINILITLHGSISLLFIVTKEAAIKFRLRFRESVEDSKRTVVV